MSVIDPPTERVCERCGRRDEWDGSRREWRIAVVDGERCVGHPQCIHEWDITASYNPFGGTASD
jgi:hypothetical protein